MSVEEVRKCDIFKTKADVKPLTVFIEYDGVPMERAPVDMSRRAYDRLLRFIERGMSPPKGRAEDD